MKFELIMELGNRFGNLFVFAFILSRLGSARRLIGKKPVTVSDKVVLSILFGIFGIVGTYFSIEFKGALVNTRIIGVATGGLLGGPMVGLFSGLIAGIHRGLIDAGGFTALACAVSPPLEGLMAGYIGKIMQNKNNKWIYAALAGAIGESMRKISVLIFSKPFPAAVELVKEIWMPMVIINSIGLALLFMIIDNIFKEREKMGAYQANLTLKIADKALPYLKNGIYSKQIGEAAKIIHSMTDFDAVSITDRNKMLASVGLSSKYHTTGENVRSSYVQEALSKGEPVIINDCNKKSECNNSDCNLSSFIVLPLKENTEIIGSLILYKSYSNNMTKIDLELGNGLARLFSTQITLSKLEHNSKLLATAELRALQSQINPHFLFNSLTVIASLCRINPDKARGLIIHLANYFRKNLNNNKELVNLDVELNHVKSYLEIEKARFEDKLLIEYDIDEDSLNYQLPPLSLQPLVENAIKHGILPKKGGGKIQILTRLKEGEMEVKIIDNGIGVTEEEIEEILMDNNKYKDSIGMSNVNHRLKGMFGTKYGLKINSTINEGTTVSFRIPMISMGLERDKSA